MKFGRSCITDINLHTYIRFKTVTLKEIFTLQFQFKIKKNITVIVEQI